MKNKIYFSFVISALIFSCNQKQTQEKQQVDKDVKQDSFCLNDQLKKSTETDSVIRRNIHQELTLPGKVEYNENDLVAFKSLLQGVVSKVNIELGDFVRKGQVLATVKSVEIQDLSQQKRTLEKQVEFLKEQERTKQQMLEDGLASKPELTALQFDLQAAEIQRDKIIESLKLYRGTSDDEFEVLAPKDGYIVQKSVSVGKSIGSGDQEPLFSISNLKQVWVMVNIYPSNLKYVKEGAAVKVKTLAFPDELIDGKIDKIYNVFDEREHVIKARIILDNKDLNLLPGLSADIIIQLDEQNRKAFAVNNEAIIFSQNKEFIVLYQNDCQLQVKQITPIARNSQYTYLQEELPEGTKVINSNALLIYSQIKN